jgi:hypothetical protein
VFNALWTYVDLSGRVVCGAEAEDFRSNQLTVGMHLDVVVAVREAVFG